MDIFDRELWERKYVDLWTIVHILTGMCFGFAIFFYHSPFTESFIAFTVFAIIWELLEFYTRANETIQNQIIDVLTGVLGFLATYKIIPLLAPSLTSQIIYFTLIYIVVWTFAYFGFQSFAIHTNRNLQKYKKSFSSAVILYIVVIAAIFLF